MAATLEIDRMDAQQKPSAEAAPAGYVGDDDENTLYFVMIKYVSRWLPFIRNNGEQAVATTLERAEAMLVEAKRHINHHSSKDGTKLAATSLRIARSPVDEL